MEIWGVAGGAVVVIHHQAEMNNLQMPASCRRWCLFLFIMAVFMNQGLINRKMQLENDLSEEADGAEAQEAESNPEGKEL